MLRSGVDPEDLVHKPLKFFKEKTGDAELGQLAFNFFEEGRLKRIEEIRAVRQTLVDDGWQPMGAKSAACTVKSCAGTGDMVERERKRLEVLRNRCDCAPGMPPTHSISCASARVLLFHLLTSCGRALAVLFASPYVHVCTVYLPPCIVPSDLSTTAHTRRYPLLNSPASCPSGRLLADSCTVTPFYTGHL